MKLIYLESKGLYRPSSGTARIAGYDIRKQIDRVRPLLGFCPQADILYEDMTVYEHLKLVAMVRYMEVCDEP